MRIDEEFRSLIPPLRPEELRDLEASIISDGCRDALVVWDDILLDGHNRYDICTKHGIAYHTVAAPESIKTREDAADWIDSNQLGRRNLTPDAFTLLLGRRYNRMKGRQGGDHGNQYVAKDQNDTLPNVAAKLAAEHAVSEATVKRAGKFAAQVAKTPELARAIAEHVPVRKAKKAVEQTRRETKRAEAAAPIKSINGSIIVGDFRKVGDRIPDGSISLILTDPPYDRKASKLLPEFATFAAAKLCDGGSLLCYVGGTQMLSALDALRPQLRYWWTIACLHSGRKTVMREYGVNVGWKAILWFVKGTRHDDTVMVTDVVSGGEEKQHHEWQQAESEASYLIDKLCPSDGIVLDPFLGGGTTAAAAKKIGRKWIGVEIDEATAKIASERIG